jgi:hypothetical protein
LPNPKTKTDHLAADVPEMTHLGDMAMMTETDHLTAYVSEMTYLGEMTTIGEMTGEMTIGGDSRNS